jgi:GGDEF domain-containing protein
MSDQISIYQSKIRRKNHVGCRLSDDEFALISAAATRENLALADWFRRTVLDSLVRKAAEDGPPLAVLLEEIQAIKLTLASTVLPILSGKRMQEEQSTALIRNCDAAKSDAAKKVVHTYQEKRKRP